LQSRRLDIPTGVGEDAVTGGGEAGEVGHHPARDEPDRRVVRQVQEVEDPSAGDLLDH
jgi:hypothetical protein